LVNNSERVRIDNSGRLLVGTPSARTNYFNSTTYGPLLNIEGTSNATRVLSYIHNDSSGGPILVLGSTGGSTAGSNTLVAAQSTLGFLSFQGADGTDLVEAASIKVQVDGTPGADDMPGRLIFSTTADGESTPTERMRIASDGRIILPTGSPGIAFDDNDTSGANVESKSLDDYELGTWTPVFGAESGTVNVTYNTNATKGWYCKVGNVVHGAFNISWTAASGTGTILWIGGIPYSYSGDSTFGPVTFQGAVSKCVGVTFSNWGGGTGQQAAVGVYSNSRMNLQFFSSNMTTTDQRAKFSALGSSGQITAEFKYLIA